MAKYLFLYYGGKMGATPREIQKSTAEWVAWFNSMGKSLVDTGTPTTAGKTVSATGVRATAKAQDVTGYTIVKADTMEGAIKMAKGAPGIAKGMKVAVYPMVEMAPPGK